MRGCIPIAVLLACSCLSGTAAAQATSSRLDNAPVDHATVGNAIAGPLVVALSEHFGGRHVDMWLKDIDVAPLEDGASIISGTGAVQIEGRVGSVGFRFQLPWNQRLQRAGYPEVSVGGAVAGERDVPNDVALVSQLEADVTAALVHHLREPAVSVRLDRIATVEGGTQFLRINAVGVAYAGRSGAGTALTIQALYDRTRRDWMRLEYGLGTEAARFVSK